MTVALFEDHLCQQAALTVEREDIRFYNLTRDRVQIEITVRNSSYTRTDPTVLHIQSAPLGAFLPWRPLRRLELPALEPGEESLLQTEAARRPVRPLGKFPKVTPEAILDALLGDKPTDFRPSARGNVPPRRDLIWGGSTRTAGDRQGRLAPDVFDYLEQGNPHWAGNINVFIGRRAVERHLARGLRIYPGRVNMAMFCVGCGPDAYSFTIQGSSLAQDASLLHMTGARCVESGISAGAEIPWREWVETHCTLLLMLAMQVPSTCEEGDVRVHVDQRSTGKSTAVEFSLDARAAGPGCYVV
jgi:hypothetical protein